MKKNVTPAILFVLCSLIFAASARAQTNITREIKASNVTLVWEAQTYVPPFYKGRALPTDGSDFTILAFPPTDLGNPSLLSYQWKVDGTVDQGASGLGRSFFRYQSDLFGGSPLIVVEVWSDNTNVGVGAIRVPLVKPRVLLYPDLPLAGILFNNQAKSSRGDEVAVEAYPLFFSTESRNAGNLSYEWSVAGASSPNPLGNSPRIIVRSEGAGTASLDLLIRNTTHILETAGASMNLSFEE